MHAADIVGGDHNRQRSIYREGGLLSRKMRMLVAGDRQQPTLEFLSHGLIALAIGASMVLLDQPVALFLRAVRADTIVVPAAVLGTLGSPTPYFVVSAVVFIYWKFEQQNALRANRALFVLLASTTAPFFTDMLKLLFGRSRPHLLLEQGIYTFRPFTNSLDFSSFPSEHATVAAAMAAVFSVLLPAYRPTFFLLAAIVALSRIVIGLHYLSDVIAGALVGMTMVAMLKLVFRRYKIKLERTR